MVEALAQQLRRLRHGALHEAEGVRIHVARQQRLDQGRAGGGHLRGLQHRHVARGHGGDERVEQQLDGEVPGADDEHHAQRLPLDVGAAGDQHSRRDGLQRRGMRARQESTMTHAAVERTGGSPSATWPRVAGTAGRIASVTARSCAHALTDSCLAHVRTCLMASSASAITVMASASTHSSFGRRRSAWRAAVIASLFCSER